MLARYFSGANGIKLAVLLVLCLQNSLFTVLRRYSQGVLQEKYSTYECLLLQEILKLVFSAWMITKEQDIDNRDDLYRHLSHLVKTSKKMIVLALIYGIMNILGFVALRNIGAGVFTVFAQTKILTTATFSRIMLRRQYSSAKWRALIALVFGVLLFSEPIWSDSKNLYSDLEGASPIIGILAVTIEVTMSGFASIYFEKVIKADAKNLTIWERNVQLAFGSFPIYLCFIAAEGGGQAGLGGGWSFTAMWVAILGAAGGLLVALSIKYGDAILKTLATTGAIVLSSFLDHALLGGPLTATMMIAGAQVVIAICNYTFDATPVIENPREEKGDAAAASRKAAGDDEEAASLVQESKSLD
jgi:UDP-sugar transporter A1/2/3